MNPKIVDCVFCQGKGKDPFELLSFLSTCQVCGGLGTVTIEEAFFPCAYCKGSGGHPHQRITCIVCHGRGVSHLSEPYITCPECAGQGIAPAEYQPCRTCKGRGVVKEHKYQFLI